MQTDFESGFYCSNEEKYLKTRVMGITQCRQTLRMVLVVQAELVQTLRMALTVQMRKNT